MQLFVPYFGVVESVPCYESQRYDEQQFQTLPCVHYTIFSVVKSDLFIRALLLDRILALEKTTRTPRVHLVRTRCCTIAKRPIDLKLSLSIQSRVRNV